MLNFQFKIFNSFPDFVTGIMRAMRIWNFEKCALVRLLSSIEENLHRRVVPFK